MLGPACVCNIERNRVGYVLDQPGAASTANFLHELLLLIGRQSLGNCNGPIGDQARPPREFTTSERSWRCNHAVIFRPRVVFYGCRIRFDRCCFMVGHRVLLSQRKEARPISRRTPEIIKDWVHTALTRQRNLCDNLDGYDAKTSSGTKRVRRDQQRYRFVAESHRQRLMRRRYSSPFGEYAGGECRGNVPHELVNQAVWIT